MAADADVLVRNRYRCEVEALLVLVADEVTADQLWVSIEVFSRVLARMLVPCQPIKRLINDACREWRRMVRNLVPEVTRIHERRVVPP